MIKTLFVIMPFGEKTDHETGRTIDFDVVYRELIKPAAIKTGWTVKRIDEIAKPGVITDQYLHEILHSDVVVADISMPNANVFYELGIRQATSSGGTILIAEENTKLPFDMSTQRVMLYRLGMVGLLDGREDLNRWLSDNFITIASNPVKNYLESIAAEVNPKKDLAAFELELKGRIERANTPEQLIAVWKWAQNLSPLPPFTLLQLAKKLSDFDEWSYSSEALRAAVESRPNDFELQRELGWHLSKLGKDSEVEALKALRLALTLNPNDPETHGMIGGVLKRCSDYEGAADHYSRGTRIAPNNLYMLVNNAAMKILSQPDMPDEGIELYRELIGSILKKPAMEQDEWDKVVLGEAYFAVGDLTSAKRAYREARLLSQSPKSIRSSTDQIRFFAERGFNTESAKQLLNWIESELLSEKKYVEVTAGPALLHRPEREKLPVIIHLSDLHFGYRDGSNGEKINMHRFIEDDYTKPLSKHLIREFSSKRAHFRQEHERLHIAITGDLTYRGKPDEFELVKSFLEELCTCLEVSKERVHIVPGNHDVDWAVSANDKEKRFDNYVGFLVSFYGEELFRAKFPYYDWDLRFNSRRPEPYKLVSTYQDEERRLLILGLNSCVYETEQDHYGFVGGDQLNLVDDFVYDFENQPVSTRVVLFHHHLHPYPEFIKPTQDSAPEVDLSTLRDSGLVQRKLHSLKFDMVLHGHKHRTQVRETILRSTGSDSRVNAKLIVCGAGSAGVSTKELPHNVSNHFEVVEILRMPRKRDLPFINLEWRELDASPDAEWSTTGNFRING